MTILELREKRAKAWEAAKAFLDSHRNDKGVLSAEDDAAYTRMEQEITDLGKEIARLERQEALDAELNRPVNKPLTGKPMNGKEENKTGRATDEYRPSPPFLSRWVCERQNKTPWERRNRRYELQRKPL